MAKNSRTDLEFMKEAEAWPLWPFLPVKNREGEYFKNNWSTLGCLINIEPFEKETRAIVYKESVDEMIDCFKKNIDFKPTILKEYDSLEALVADGWIVD